MKEFFETISAHYIMFLIVVASILLALSEVCTTIQNIIITRTRIKYDNKEDKPSDH